MTTAPHDKALISLHEREKQLFFYFSIAIAATAIIGFGSFILVGISSFSAPWWVHVHAVTFSAWICLYVTQSRLALNNSLEYHRQLGRIGAVLMICMVAVGIALTPVAIATGGMPPFFTAPVFLALDWVNIMLFGLLVIAALYHRRQTDWHMRLMLCATICVIAPALGRLLGLMGAATPLNNVALLLLYVGVGMFADWRMRGHIHPAYYWGGGAIVVMAPATNVLSSIPIFQALANGLLQN